MSNVTPCNPCLEASGSTVEAKASSVHTLKHSKYWCAGLCPPEVARFHISGSCNGSVANPPFLLAMTSPAGAPRGAAVYEASLKFYNCFTPGLCPLDASVVNLTSGPRRPHSHEPLADVLLVVAPTLAVAGLPVSAGISEMGRFNVAVGSSPCVAAACAAGAVCVGIANSGVLGVDPEGVARAASDAAPKNVRRSH